MMAKVENATEKAEQAATTVSNVIASSWSAAKPGLTTLVKRTGSALSPFTDDLVQNVPAAQAVVKRANDVKAGVEGVKSQIQTLQGRAIEANEKAKTTIESKTWWRAQWNDNKDKIRARGFWGGLAVDTGDKVERVLARRWAEEEIDSVLPRRKIDLGLIRSECVDGAVRQQHAQGADESVTYSPAQPQRLPPLLSARTPKTPTVRSNKPSRPPCRRSRPITHRYLGSKTS